MDTINNKEYIYIYINQILKAENNYKKYHLTNIKHTQ